MTETDPCALTGVHVLIPRAPGRGGALARRIEAAGGTAVVAPLISRQAIDGAERAALDDAVAQLAAGAFAWVAVTSVNAVDELAASAQRVEGSTPGTSPLGRLATAARWAVVGPATARALAAHGIIADLLATQNSATGMLDAWPAADAAQPTGAPRVLLPLGDLARPTLEHGLTDLGYTPVRVTAYRTVSHPAPPEVAAAWRAGAFDAVVLTSGSVAREVAAQLGPRPDVLAVAIGEPTREAALAVGQPVAVVADAASDDALFAALCAATSAPASAADLLDPTHDAAIIDRAAHPAAPAPSPAASPHTPEET